MAEHIGIIKSAGEVAKESGEGTTFQLVVERFHYYLFSETHKKFAQENIGKTVKITYTQPEDSKYRNVQSIELASAPAPSRPSGNGYRGKSPEERAEIQQQVAVYATANLWAAGKLKDEDLEVIGLRAWLKKHLGGAPPAPVKTAPAKRSTGTPPPPDPPEESQLLDQVLDKGESEGEAEKVIHRDTSSITDKAAFCKACWEDFHLQPDEARKKTGCTTWGEIADWGQAYLNVVGLMGATIAEPST